MTLRHLLLILRARWRVILAAFVLIVSGTLGVTLLLPKQYTATVSILVDARSRDPIYGTPMSAAPSVISTEVDIINSDRVAYRTVKMLGLDRDPTAVRQWQAAGPGMGTVESYYAALLQKGLDIQPPQNSNVIALSYTNKDPQLAALTANTFARAYMDTRVELRADPAKLYSAWFSVQTKQMREDLEKAQAKLSAYKGSHGLVGSDEKADIENGRLAELSMQLATIQAARVESASRHQQAVTSAANSPDEIASPVIVGLRTDIAHADAKLQQLSATVGPNHPQYQSAQQELAQLKAKLASEMAQVTTAIGTTNQVNMQREAEARVALDAQKKRVLAIQQQRDELSLLQKDVESAQRNYDAVSQRLAQTSLESQAEQTNVSLLAPAAEPIMPSKPKVLLCALIAVFAGLWVGIGMALLLELSDRRVRGVEDLVESLNLPVLAVLKTNTFVAKRRRKTQRLLGRRPSIALPQKQT